MPELEPNTSEAVQTEDATPTEQTPIEAAQQVPADETAAVETPPEKVYRTLQEALADADPDELLRDPRIEGRIGQVADKRARDLARQQRADAEAERLRTLRKTDPLGYVNEVDRQESEADQAVERTRSEQQLAERMLAPLNDHLQKTLPKEALSQLAGKQYSGSTHGEALMAYVDDIVSVRLEHEVSAARKKWEAEDRPALRKQVLAELNGGEDASPEPVSNGAVRGPSFNSNLEASVALQEGRISIDRYRQLSAQHGWR